MNYKEYNDNELLSYVFERDEFAEHIIYEKYKGLVINYAKKVIQYNSHLGLEINDLIQEGLLALSSAMNTYNEKMDASFYTYAKQCIENKINSQITTANRKKHKFLNESLSLELSEEENSMEVRKNIGDYRNNPEELIIEEENVELIKKIAKEKLTDFEYKVFELKSKGLSYKEISKILKKNVKSVDNALKRIRMKLKKN